MQNIESVLRKNGESRKAGRKFSHRTSNSDRQDLEVFVCVKHGNGP